MVALLLFVMAYKVWLNIRININWDEFFYLSQIGEFQRGGHIPALQTMHVRFFGWLTGLQALEVGQVLVARFVMAVGLLATVFFLWRLAALWVEGWAVWVAPLAYLLASPVFRHGSSFRSDSILAPTITCAVFLLCRMPRERWTYVVAGMLLGLAGAVSIKAILALPMILGVIALTSGAEGLRAAIARTTLAGVAALCVFLLSVYLHGMSIAPGLQPESNLATAAVYKTVLNQDIFPVMRHLHVTWVMDRLIWLMMGLGFLVAIARRQYVAAALAMSLLPLLFYRNAFPYYYVVMLAPATVLAALGVDAVGSHRFVGRWRSAAILFFLVVWLAFGAKFLALAKRLSEDRVSHQSALVAAVHKIFPEPVPYIDHSGMIASFPKVAPFMSSWGVANYVEAGTPFMPAALGKKPPLLLVNAPVLYRRSGALRDQGLLPKDKDVLADGYLHYWGPIFVAGAAVVLDGHRPSAVASPPYPGRYRVLSSGVVRVNGVPVRSGSIIDVPIEGVQVSLDNILAVDGGGIRVALIDARAESPPSSSMASRVIYDPL